MNAINLNRKTQILYIIFFLFIGSSFSYGQSKHILCVSAHPDDAESGCGGTLAKHKAKGDKITIIYITKGEAGIANTDHNKAAVIREKEVECSTSLLKAKAIFFKQIDGDTKAEKNSMDKMVALIDSLKPDIVYNHWPIDSHRDHQVSSLLTTQAWYYLGKTFDLYFYEVCAGSQTNLFNPNHFEDITEVSAIKKEMVYCHKSQNPHGIYHDRDCNHQLMQQFRGTEIGVLEAEAFVKWERVK
jgi:LmbE family N-acetylglucosaminyl deacetylase